jgi:hypothetical protein
MKNPTGSANKIAPRIEAVRSKFSCMVGMREAQLAKHNPCMKKITLTEIRFALTAEEMVAGSASLLLLCLN